MGETRNGRIRVSLRPADDAPAAPRRDEIPRIVRLLALAHRWHRLIDQGTVESQAEIARMTGLTRARVSQIMNLRWFSPLHQTRLTSWALSWTGQGEPNWQRQAELFPLDLRDPDRLSAPESTESEDRATTGF